MGIKKSIKKLYTVIDKEIQDSYRLGYQDGFDDAILDQDLSFNRGVKAERDRVVGLFKMLSEQELTAGSGNKAKLYRDMAELVAIANMDFDNQEDEDGF